MSPSLEPVRKTAVADKLTFPVGAVGRAKKLRAEIRAVDRLRPIDVIRMHLLFTQYYEDHPLETFKSDLAEKDHVILLRDQATGIIQGFSTLLRVEIPTEKGPVRGVYSGDTVISKDYWGSAALGLAFLKYLWLEKWRTPFRPLYWFLISKGYKTYLLMANNFTRHYPRLEEKTPPHFQRIIDDFYGRRFEKTYRPTQGLIVPEGTSCRVKEEVAPITPELLKIPRIAFFQARNPSWTEGVELCCLAEMTLFMPLKYAVKKALRKLGL